MSEKKTKFLTVIFVPILMIGLFDGFSSLMFVLEGLQPSFFVDVYYKRLGKEKLQIKHRSKITNGEIKIAIAHAGGGLNGMTYRNDMPALMRNAPHYKFIEVDFLFTSDQKLVCLHDWRATIHRLWGGDTSNALSFDEFLKLTGDNGCTLDRLARLLKEHPHIILITDVKSRGNVTALRQIHQTLSDANHRVIPQIYSPYEFFDVREIGYEKIILTLYKSGITNALLKKHLNYLDLFAVTMPARRATSKFIGDLKKLRPLKVFTHTTNKCDEAYRLFAIGVDGIYTDWLRQQNILGDQSSCETKKRPY